MRYVSHQDKFFCGCRSGLSMHTGAVEIEFSRQTRVMWLSLVTAGVLLVAKVIAAALTGSSAIYSDAAESVVHFLAVAFAVWALRWARKPADEDHHYGHDKVAYLSAGFEGAMISAAALLILYEAGRQFVFGVEIENLQLGIIITAGAGILNLVLGCALLAEGKRSGSPLVRANGMHVLTYVWSSVAVLVALLLYGLTDWPWWDPVAATIAALNILRIGCRLLRESAGGLLDESDPTVELKIRAILDRETHTRGLSYHNLRHRHSGHTHWVEFHLVFDDETCVGTAHEAATDIESAVNDLLHPEGRVISHLEPRSAEHASECWENRA